MSSHTSSSIPPSAESESELSELSQLRIDAAVLRLVAWLLKTECNEADEQAGSGATESASDEQKKGGGS